MIGRVHDLWVITTNIGRSRVYVPILLTMGTLTLWLTSTGPNAWLGRAADTGLFVGALTFVVLGPVCVIIGFAAARSVRRYDYDLVSRSARGVHRILVLRVLTDLSWLTLVFASLYGGALIVGIPLQGGSGVPWSLLTHALSLAFLTYSIGLLVGALSVSSWLAIPVAILPYALAFASAYIAREVGVEWTLLFAPFIEATWYPARVPNAVGILLLTAYTASVSIALIATAIVRLSMASMVRSGLVRRVSVSALCAAAIAGILLNLTWTPNLFSTDRSSESLCTPSVCVWPENGAELEAWESSSQKAREIAGDFGVFSDLRFYERGFDPTDTRLVVPVAAGDNSPMEAVTFEMTRLLLVPALADCDFDVATAVENEVRTTIEDESRVSDATLEMVEQGC